MQWWVHWGIQSLLARAPGGRAIHRLMQERVGQLRRIETGNQFDNALQILKMASRESCSLAGQRVVEIGTGWVPAISVALALVGCEVHTFDVSALTKPDYLRRTLAAWYPRLDEIAVAANQLLIEVAERWERLSRGQSLEDLLQKHGGTYLAPCDTTALPLASESVDLVLSNLVLQCVAEEQVVPVLRESARVLRPSGRAIHRIRMTDEYAQGDPNRHHLHFLTYEQETWNRWFNHRLKNQNRWRTSQFLQAFHDVGFLQHEVCRFRDIRGAAYFQQVALAPEFLWCDEDDLNTIGIDVVLHKTSSGNAPLNSQVDIAHPESSTE